MTTDLGPGTLLVALDGSNPHPRNLRYPLTVGAIYRVQRTYEGQSWQHHKGLCPKCNSPVRVVIEEKPWWGYSVCMFRPLNDGDDSLVAGEEDLNPYAVLACEPAS